MTHRSFSLANTAEEAQKDRQLWSSQFPSSTLQECDESPLSAQESPILRSQTSSQPTNANPPQQIEPTAPQKNPTAPANRQASPRRVGPPLPIKYPAKPQDTLITKASTEDAAIAPSSSTHTPSSLHNPVKPKDAPFDERYQRITTYLEKMLYQRVQSLHKNGHINRITSLMNAAVQDYLDRHYYDH